MPSKFGCRKRAKVLPRDCFSQSNGVQLCVLQSLCINIWVPGNGSLKIRREHESVVVTDDRILCCIETTIVHYLKCTHQVEFERNFLRSLTCFGVGNYRLVHAGHSNQATCEVNSTNALDKVT